MVDPIMHVWGWEIPVYLFLGGMVAGMMIISGYFLFSGRYQKELCACYILPGLAIILLSLGMLALFLDLEHKLYFWRLYLTFEPASPMSWGSWILLLVYPALLLNLLMRPPDFLVNRWARLAEIRDQLRQRAQLVRWIGAANMILGGLLGVYSGVLLSTLVARPLWNSAILGPLFLVSGLSSAAAFIHMIAPDRAERELLAKADNAFLITELILLGLFVIGLASASEVHIEAIGLFLGGPYTAMFWVFVVGIGIVLPLVIQLLAVNHRIMHTPVAPILVIAGGLLLRFVFVFAGQLSRFGGI